MNWIAYVIGYFLTILLVNVFSTEYTLMSEPIHHVSSQRVPLNFVYTKSNFLFMQITLINIPPSVTAAAVQLNYKDYGSEVKKVDIEKTTSELKIMILKRLSWDYISVDVELYSQQKVCGATNIAEGVGSLTKNEWERRGNGYNEKYYYKIDYCMAPIPCEIVVDLENKCQEQPPSTYFSCNIEATEYICTYERAEQENTWIHRIYQTYDNDSYIGPAPEMSKISTNLYRIIVKLEVFDNNTSVNIATTRNKKPNIIWSSKLSFTAKDISEDYNSVTILRYSETKYVTYRCQEHNDIYKRKVAMHIGLINTTDNKITTLNKTSIRRTFKMAENGTILCCIYYTSHWDNNGKSMNIRRFVENKTLLIYQSQESTSPNLTESEGLTTTPLTDWLIYLVPAFFGICFLMLVLYIIKQKRCCINSHAVEETVELDDCATQNQVLYADLDFVRDEIRPQGQNEESHYANIIGVLHPL